jgi:hypothetical protein
MIVRLRRRYAGMLVSGGGQLLFLMLGVHLESRAGWIFSLCGVAVLSFLAWIATVRRWRAIGDTPTSQVASAAQGYVELAGRARNHAGGAVIAPHSQLPCCWYRYLVEKRRSGNKGWKVVDEGESDASFLLVDATGETTVEPQGAEVLPRSRDTWGRGDYRYTEWRIVDGDPLYVLGEFTTRGAAPTAREAREDVGALLAAWKQDKPGLMRRFDLDRDGTLDFREWSLARSEAKRQVERAHAELRAMPGYDVVAKPADGRLFLLSNLDRAKLEQKYLFWAWVHLALFFVAFGVVLWLVFLRR